MNTVISILLALEGAYFTYTGWVWLDLARKIRSMGGDADNWGGFTFFLLSLVMFVAAFCFATRARHITRWLRYSGLLLIPYGAWIVYQGVPAVLSWWGVFTGDLVALGVVSGFLLLVVGILMLLPGQVDRG